MRAWWLLALLTVPALTGCLSFLDDDGATGDSGVRPADVGYDPAAIRVTGFVQHDVDIVGFDNTSLSAMVLEPQTTDALPNGSAPSWPVVVFLHPWAVSKEWWSDVPWRHTDGSVAQLGLLEAFAQAGFLTVAYDARGFGQSDGQSTIAGPAEQADLSAVISHVTDTFATSDFIGVTGTGYGAGQAALAWAHDDRVTTAALHGEWTDLYYAMAPGNVPKIAWVEAITGASTAGSRGRVAPMVNDWHQAFYTRNGLDEVAAQMGSRGVAPAHLVTDKPVLLCEGMQDSFTNQHHWTRQAPGFVRTIVYTGGHMSVDAACWQATMDWFQFFLAGHDNGIDAMPALTTVDAANTRSITYGEEPVANPHTWSLQNGQLADGTGDQGTFTVQQRLVANPFEMPDVVADLTGNPAPAVPTQIRQDPTAVRFESAAFTDPQVLMGAPVVTLELASNTTSPFQVVATLLHETVADGRSRQLGRSAYAVLDEGDHDNGTVTLHLPWTRAHVRGGDRIVLEIAANDPANYLPLFQNYEATFTSVSRLDVSFVE